MFKAALSELRTEIQIMRRNDTQLLQTEASLITREVENLAQKLREDVATMKNEITLDMNNRKNETREEQKVIDMRIQEINNKLTVSLGDVRTGLEAVRWETIWKGMSKLYNDQGLHKNNSIMKCSWCCCGWSDYRNSRISTYSLCRPPSGSFGNRKTKAAQTVTGGSSSRGYIRHGGCLLTIGIRNGGYHRRGGLV